MHRALIESPCCFVRRLGGNRRNEIRFHRLLRHKKVTVLEMAAAAGARCGAVAAGRDVAVIQDTSEIYAGGKELAEKGFGPIGKGGATRGVLAHVAIAVDVADGGLLGVADLAVWTRQGGQAAAPARNRAYADKESYCWLRTAKAAGERLKSARSITVVSDAESDIYDYFAGKPEGVELLVRARHDRGLAAAGNEGLNEAFEKMNKRRPALVSEALAGLAAAQKIAFQVPAIPGRKARAATLSLRFAAVTVERPGDGAKSLPESLAISIVEVREEAPPEGVEPLHWRLVTSHKVEDVKRATEIVAMYRGRFQIEELFRTMKSGAIDIESAGIEHAKAFITFTAFTAIAASSILQMVKARDGTTGQPVTLVFDPEDMPLLKALCRKLEGKTVKQKNPHSPDNLAYATWIIARLGAWNGYYGKPGPKTIRWGYQRFQAIKQGFQLSDEM